MAFKFVLLALPALAFAKINIEVSGRFEDNLEFRFSGQENDVISDIERNTFKLSEETLKNGAEGYFGQRPDNVYVRSPTPWGDLYRSYGWKQVTRTLVPKRGRILSMTSQPVVVMKQRFENNSSKPAAFNVGISQPAKNSMTSFWTKGGELTIEREIAYEFDIDFQQNGGRTSMDFSSKWGKNSERFQPLTGPIGSESRIEVMLQPGQSVVSKLEATKAILKLEVEFEASLNGDVAINFDSMYKNHHFWALGVDTLMSRAGLNNTFVSKQVMEISLFGNSNVNVYDVNTNEKMLNVSA